ncbi:hypothetical protein EXIGLDRAFT_774863 [Exidia glandulosa HHB12029]|uniref:Uncharacterized protein n=1 Tax=Exidia glandulosa HHB12029 TaxID=1314781 RepID=A0A165E6Z1_EXIGL|nr:hypothetical protein EXIGLDRAFT_774863 [Exidia glandulosa HHB12029]
MFVGEEPALDHYPPREPSRLRHRFPLQPDLRKFALARASAVLASTKEPTPEHKKKTRGKKTLKA